MLKHSRSGGLAGVAFAVIGFSLYAVTKKRKITLTNREAGDDGGPFEVAGDPRDGNAVTAQTLSQNREPRLTFGVDDPHGHHLYTLRQSRYDALAHDINNLARAAASDAKKLSVLDVGCGDGALLRYLEAKPEFANMIISAADLRVDRWLYKKICFTSFL